MLCGECGRSVGAATPSGETQKRPLARAAPSNPEPLVEPTLVVEPVAVVDDRPLAEAPTVAPSAELLIEEPIVELSLERCSQCGAELEASDIFCGECGFVRHPAIVTPPRANDTVGYDPFPWGLPRSTDGPRPVPPERAAAPAAAAPPEERAPAREVDPDVEATRIVDRSATGERFVLQFSTGESVSVSGTGLLGRNPVPEPGEYFDVVVAISDPGKSVSKTHLEFGQEAGSFWVSDRFSGNGTTVREPDRQPRRCDPGKRYRVMRGTRIDIGEQFFIVS